jgi:hypothetical protein
MISSTQDPRDTAIEALSTLAEYLERSLDSGKSLILVRSQREKSEVYLGDAGEPQEDWVRCGLVRNSVVSAILEATQSGPNELAIAGQTYRFVRTFTQVDNHGAVVISAS